MSAACVSAERARRAPCPTRTARRTDHGEHPPAPDAADPTPDPTPGLDTGLTEALIRTRRFFTRAEVSPDLRALHRVGGRQADEFYRDRWSHDKVVRSTHGVNCTGSCSWKVYVKDGIITWEAQQTDYPSAGPDRPEYEPRGCPRGAAFSWYTYSPTRVRYPYVRGVLLELYREARSRLGDPVLAWADVVFDRPDGAPATLWRGVPVRRVGGHLVTTVFDLLLAQYGVHRPGLPGRWPRGYDDAEQPCAPACRRRSPACPRGRRRGSGGSSRPTPRRPAAGP